MQVNDATTPLTSAMGASGPAPGQLGKEQFLMLLVAQIGHQDPLNPLDDKEFVAQLAQFSSLEQAVQMNERLAMLEVGQSAALNTQVTGLIGKQVTATGDKLELGAPGEAAPLALHLGAAASKVTAKIYDGSGKLVRTLELGSMGQGAQHATWDGRDDQGTPLPAGDYRVEYEASDLSGASVPVTAQVVGIVTGVSFDKGYPELLLGSERIRPADVTEIRSL